MVMSEDLNAGLSHIIKTHNISYERLVGNNLNESKFYSGRNEEQIAVRECLLSFGAGSFVFQSKNSKIKIYRTIILPVVWYGCETRSLTLREERRLRVFKNMVLRRVFFGSKRDDVTGEWRKLHNEQLNDPYFSPSIVRVIKSRRMGLKGGGGM
jgi:hypothetical protein